LLDEHPGASMATISLSPGIGTVAGNIRRATRLRPFHFSGARRLKLVAGMCSSAQRAATPAEAVSNAAGPAPEFTRKWVG
jgi:hypothetical protein